MKKNKEEDINNNIINKKENQENIRNNNIKGKNKTDYLYKMERVCGNGSFGIVFQAKKIHTGEIVAIKKVYQDKRYRNREYAVMKNLDHPNIVKLYHAFYTTGEKQDEIYLNLVMNYASDNLNRINKYYAEKKEMIPTFLLKLYFFQIARALNYIHSKHICHRDIKPQNILVDPNTNKVYLCDFGSAKVLRKDEPNVAYICSRFYRAPELLLGNEKYDESIDIWSFACVIVEMIKGKPFLRTEDTDGQIKRIIDFFGGPKEEDLIGIPKAYEIAESTKKIKPKKLESIFTKCPKDLIDLLNNMFLYNPRKRLTAMEIMAHPFFDDLRNKELCTNNGKFMVPNIFNFTEKEIKESPKRKLWAKIIPDWSDGYKNLLNFLNSSK